MTKIIDRLLACGVDLSRSKMLLNYYGTDGKWEDLEKYVDELESYQKGANANGVASE